MDCVVDTLFEFTIPPPTLPSKFVKRSHIGRRDHVSSVDTVHITEAVYHAREDWKIDHGGVFAFVLVSSFCMLLFVYIFMNCAVISSFV